MFIIIIRCAEVDNSVEKYLEKTANFAEKMDMREKHSALKKVYKDLKNSYKSLKDMTEQQMKQSPQLNLVDPRVRELWTLAQSMNMTEDKLSSFKVSLLLSPKSAAAENQYKGVVQIFTGFTVSNIVLLWCCGGCLV